MDLIEEIRGSRETLMMDQRVVSGLLRKIAEALQYGRFKEAEKVIAADGLGLGSAELEILVDKIRRAKKERSVLPSDGRPVVTGEPAGAVSRIERHGLFFIVGCPKSGTTWLQNILNGHPNIWCSGEQNLKKLGEMLERVATNYNKDVADINEGHIGKSDGYLMFNQTGLRLVFVHTVLVLFGSALAHMDIACIGAKNPDLIRDLELFGGLLPRARFIHIIRDGRDVAVSGWFHNQRMHTALTRQYPQLSAYVESCAKYWQEGIHAARTFGQRNPERYLETRYEDLHTAPDQEIGRILQFLGVNRSKPIVDLCRLAGAFERAADGRARGQEDGQSFFRKGIAGDWKNHFDGPCVNAFVRHGGQLLQELGYE